VQWPPPRHPRRSGSSWRRCPREADRKLDNGARHRREADRLLKRPASKYSIRKAGQVRRPTRRVTAKVLTLHPEIIQ